MLDEILLFLRAVTTNWVTYMGAGPVLIDQIAQWSFQPYRDWTARHGSIRKLCVTGLIALGISWANFEAWVEQYQFAKGQSDLAGERLKEIEGIDGQGGLRAQVGALKEKIHSVEQKLDDARSKPRDETVRFIKPPDINLYSGHPQRHLSDDQKKKLIETLAPLKAELHGLQMYSEAGESARYLLDFMDVHRKAGIEVDGPYTAGISGESDSGVMVGFTNPEKPSSLGVRYIEALRAVGITVRVTKSGGTGSDQDFDLFICDQ